VPSPAELGPGAWAVLLLGGLLIGVSKTAFAGVGTLAGVAFALVLPTRGSTGAVLPLLILGDVIALSLYRRHADWHLLVRLLPSLLVGLVLGVAFRDAVDDTALRRTLGVLLLVLAALQGRAFLRRGDGAAGTPPDWSRARLRTVGALAGGGAGFSTMIANAAGPISSMYLLAMLAFLGTASWQAGVINLVKVPFSAGLGLLDASSLRLDAVVVPAVLVGAAIGVVVLRRVDQRAFEVVTLALTAASAVAFLLL
jgi:uncharacterized membrane protein YfcA